MNLKGKLTSAQTLTAKQAIAGGSSPSGDVTWNQVRNKPFNTLSNDFTVNHGALELATTPVTEVDWDDIQDKPTFATVATSGDYNDLSNLPTIPVVPTDVSAFNNDAGYITDTALTPYVTSTDLSTALTPYVESTSLATVATTGDYDDLLNKPTIPAATSVTVTQTLSTGTEIGQIDVDGTTTVLYAPEGGSGDVPIRAGSNSTYPGIIECYQSGSQASGAYAHAEGAGVSAMGGGSHAEGYKTFAASSYQHVQGKNNIADSNAVYADIIGNGNGIAEDPKEFDNAEATDWNGNKYLAGDIYTHVTNWATPQSNSIKLANIPAAPTVQGTYSLQVVVDANGDPTYSWI